MLEDNIPSVYDDEFSGFEEPPISEESPACQTKKRKKRDNSSIVWDYFNIETTEKGDFTVCRICKEKNITVKYAHDSLTGNMLGHLWSKHRIDKDHPEETNTNGSIIKAMHVITKRRQEKITQLLDSSSNQRCVNKMELLIPGLGWLKELRKAIEYLVLMLPSESECCDRLDGEYLKLINLTENEWRLLDNLILLLKPFYEATTIFSGSSYPTHNLIYPTMRLLIKKFAPSYEQTEDDYTDLLFEPSSRHVKKIFIKNKNICQSQLIEENDPESDIENEFDASMISEQLRQPLQAARGRKKKQVHSKAKKIIYDLRFKGRQSIEPPVNNERLCDLVKATSYFSLKEYWEVPERIGLVASFLDPRIKNLKFLDNEAIKATIFDTVRALCVEEKNHQPIIRPDESVNTPVREPVTTNGLIADLYSSEELDGEAYDETEVDRYLREPIEKKGCNPLTWWKDRSEKYPVLSRLVRKYLSVPATSVPSERLFSDAGLHITTLRNRLHPDMVEQMLFLKRNMQHFPIFKPDELNKSNDA
ncbi:23936_t:CDS:2 [Cetraspora pellucida]|uniref:23936_t:CDS:1 n=1 Tax=Cetraspora pellucida TaxID=1433469 RepID=A0A9N9E3P1_9GLOM|nr:23936_t:CDS:2 [Cetraspora pellucida]